MGRSCVVAADICDARVPAAQLRLEIHDIDEYASGQEVAFDVLHSRLDLAFSASAVLLAHPRLEAPVLGERPESAVPTDSRTAFARTAYRRVRSYKCSVSVRPALRLPTIFVGLTRLTGIELGFSGHRKLCVIAGVPMRLPLKVNNMDSVRVDPRVSEPTENEV